jgi:hypothetical protein
MTILELTGKWHVEINGELETLIQEYNFIGQPIVDKDIPYY